MRSQLHGREVKNEEMTWKELNKVTRIVLVKGTTWKCKDPLGKRWYGSAISFPQFRMEKEVVITDLLVRKEELSFMIFILCIRGRDSEIRNNLTKGKQRVNRKWVLDPTYQSPKPIRHSGSIRHLAV